MGVKTCNRRSCTGIMCDRYSEEYGYICDSCFKELVLTGNRSSIESFMDSNKSSNMGDQSMWENLCETRFPLQED